MAPPFLIASLRSASSERAEFMASKAAEEGKFAVLLCQILDVLMCEVKPTVFDRHGEMSVVLWTVGLENENG